MNQTQQTPSVGRIVHIHRGGGWGKDSEPRAGIITGVNPDGTIDAFLFLRRCDLEGVAVPSSFLAGVPQAHPAEVIGDGVYVFNFPPFVPPKSASTTPPLTDEQKRDIADQDSDASSTMTASEFENKDNGDA